MKSKSTRISITILSVTAGILGATPMALGQESESVTALTETVKVPIAGSYVNLSCKKNKEFEEELRVYLEQAKTYQAEKTEYEKNLIAYHAALASFEGAVAKAEAEFQDRVKAKRAEDIELRKKLDTAREDRDRLESLLAKTSWELNEQSIVGLIDSWFDPLGDGKRDLVTRSKRYLCDGIRLRPHNRFSASLNKFNALDVGVKVDASLVAAKNSKTMEILRGFENASTEFCSSVPVEVFGRRVDGNHQILVGRLAVLRILGRQADALRGEMLKVLKAEYDKSRDEAVRLDRLYYSYAFPSRASLSVSRPQYPLKPIKPVAPESAQCEMSGALPGNSDQQTALDEAAELIESADAESTR